MYCRPRVASRSLINTSLSNAAFGGTGTCTAPALSTRFGVAVIGTAASLRRQGSLNSPVLHGYVYGINATESAGGAVLWRYAPKHETSATTTTSSPFTASDCLRAILSGIGQSFKGRRQIGFGLRRRTQLRYACALDGSIAALHVKTSGLVWRTMLHSSTDPGHQLSGPLQRPPLRGHPTRRRGLGRRRSPARGGGGGSNVRRSDVMS